MIAGFFRHGPAVARGSSGIADDQRPLTAEGREKTARAACGLRTLDLDLDAVFTSPLPRALESAEIVAKALRLPPPKILEALLPSAAAAGVLKVLRDLRRRTPLLVGHEPQLSAAVSLAIGAPASGALELKKAGLAVVEWGERPRGTLKLLLSPSSLRRLRP